MPNPVDVPLVKDQWTKVATNVLEGFVWVRTTKPALYLHTYRLTGDPPPISRDEGLPFPYSYGAPILSSNSIDVYIWSDQKDGAVRVDV